jgi:hypothetical protein
VGDEENARARPRQEGKEQSADGTSYNHRSEQYNGPWDAGTEGNGGPVLIEHATGAHFLAQGSRTATATQSAPSGAQKEPATAKPGTALTPPPAEAAAQITATSVPVKGSGRDETGNISPGSQHSDRFDIQIRVGADDSVQITANPVSDQLALPGEHCERPLTCPISEMSLQAAGWQEREHAAPK